MRKNILLFVATFLLFAGCTNTVQEVEETINEPQYSFNDQFDESQNIEITPFQYILDAHEPDADYKELKSIAFDGGCGSYKADEKNVYFGGILVEEIDLDTFDLMTPTRFAHSYDNMNFAYDKNNVYKYIVGGKGCHNTVGRIEGVNPDGLEYLGAEYFLYENRIYYVGKINQKYAAWYLKKADPETFEILSYNYAKDKNYIFHDGEIFDLPDYDSFITIENIHGKDKDNCYTYDGIDKTCYASAFERYDNFMSKSDEQKENILKYENLYCNNALRKLIYDDGRRYYCIRKYNQSFNNYDGNSELSPIEIKVPINYDDSLIYKKNGELYDVSLYSNFGDFHDDILLGQSFLENASIQVTEIEEDIYRIYYFIETLGGHMYNLYFDLKNNEFLLLTRKGNFIQTPEAKYELEYDTEEVGCDDEECTYITKAINVDNGESYVLDEPIITECEPESLCIMPFLYAKDPDFKNGTVILTDVLDYPIGEPNFEVVFDFVGGEFG